MAREPLLPRLPGVCRGCRSVVVWTGQWWGEPVAGGAIRHVCGRPVTLADLFAEMAANDPEFADWRAAEAIATFPKALP